MTIGKKTCTLCADVKHTCKLGLTCEPLFAIWIGKVTIILLRFAYIEFSDKESVRTSLALDESLFRGRQIKVSPMPITVLVLCELARLTLRLSVVHPSLSGDPKTNQQTRHQHDRPGFPTSPIPCPDHQLQQFPFSILQWF